MKLDQTFTVQAHPDVVWRALTDVMRVAPNLPGAAITEDAGDGIFKGELKVKIGPTTAAYDGALKMEHLDEEQRVATMSARGNDKRGNGGATATIVSRVNADDATGGARVDVETDVSITGKLARFGRGGMIQDVSNRLLREFAANLQEDLAGEGVGAGNERGAAVADTAAPDTPPPDGGASAARPRALRPLAEPLDGGRLVLGMLTDRLKAALPAFAAGVVVGVLVVRRSS